MAYDAGGFKSYIASNGCSAYFMNKQQKVLIKVFFITCALFILSGVFAQTKFGALIAVGNTPNRHEYQVMVAKKLGIRILRFKYVLTNPTEKVFPADFDVFLNINYGKEQQGKEKVPVPFPTDLENYQQLLTNAIKSFKGKMPVVVAIENEEDNFQYHSGSPQDYINELKTAIPIIHAAGMQICNAGLTAPGIAYLVYNNLRERGLQAEAEAYERSTQLQFDKPWIKRKGEFVRQTLEAYKTMDIDFVNFHWYGKSIDASALKTTIEFLKQATNKPVITNEIGQYDNSPETIKAVLQVCREENLPYVIWNSGLNKGPGKSVSLQNPDGTLKPNGEAFREMIAGQQQ